MIKNEADIFQNNHVLPSHNFKNSISQFNFNYYFILTLTTILKQFKPLIEFHLCNLDKHAA